VADKQTKLSIVLSAVDRATSVVKRVNERLEAITKPVSKLGKELGSFRENLGIDKVAAGFGGVGTQLQNMWSWTVRLGLAAGAAGLAFKSITDHFDNLGDAAERAGVSADFLAQMRYVAKQSGAEVSDLDGGIQTFTKNLGQARAGTGRMASFLTKVSPPLLKQLKATKSNEEALLLYADAMRKVEDPAKRAALANAGFGTTALSPMLARGEEGIGALAKRYVQLAGSQEGAVKASGEVDSAFHDLDATLDGVKAAIASGLGPAFRELIERVSKFFTENRERISVWVKDLGDKLPGAISSAIDAFDRALAVVKPVWDTIGGLSGAVTILAAVIVGKLIYAIGALGVALLTTPIGWFMLGISAIVGAVALIVKYWEPIKGFFVGLWDAVTSAFSGAWDFIKSIVDKVVGAVDTVREGVRSVLEFVPGNTSLGSPILGNTDAARSALAGAGGAGETRLKVEFANAPRGMRVSTDAKSTGEVDLSTGYNLLPGGL
jgi:phage-related minor tail protein